MTVQKNKQSGFTIAEMLIALAVMALLLTAVAVAFNASAINYNENRDMFEAMNSGRQAMMRMTSELRTAKKDTIPVISSGEPITQCSFTDTNGQLCKFIFSNGELRFNYIDSSNNSHSPLLCGNIADMKFSRALGANGKVNSVQMSMTVTVNGNSQTIATGVVLRKAI